MVQSHQNFDLLITADGNARFEEVYLTIVVSSYENFFARSNQPVDWDN